MKKLIILTIAFLLILNPLIKAEKCEDIYFLVSNTNYQMTSEQLQLINSTFEDIYNYKTLCENSKYPYLPQINAPVLLIDNSNIEECDYENSGLWESIPFFKIPVNPSCKSIQWKKYFFRFEKIGNNYLINGIVVFPVLVLILIGSFLGFRKHYRRIYDEKN